MKVYLLTSVDVSGIHEIDAECILNTGCPYLTLEGAKRAAQETDEDIKDYNNTFADVDQQHEPHKLDWVHPEATVWQTTDNGEWAVMYMIRELEVQN